MSFRNSKSTKLPLRSQTQLPRVPSPPVSPSGTHLRQWTGQEISLTNSIKSSLHAVEEIKLFFLCCAIRLQRSKTDICC